MPLAKLFYVNSQGPFFWDCRRLQICPTIAGFKAKIDLKFKTEKYICSKNKTLMNFTRNGRYCLLYNINFYMYLQYLYFSTHIS